MGVVSEVALALELGLSRDGLAEMRKVHCVQGVDWELVKREVRLSLVAAERLKALVGCPDSENKKNGQDGDPGAILEPVLLVVTRGARNARILMAKKKEGGAEVRVRVRSNVNFMAGMEIRATPHPEYDDFFDLVGRCPRQRGRW